MRKPRKNYTPVEKVAILHRHLIDDVLVPNLCDEHQLSPTLFYLWQMPFFEGATAAFERRHRSVKSECVCPNLPRSLKIRVALRNIMLIT